MNRTTLHKLGLLLLSPLVMMGTQCPEFPKLEDIEITVVHEDFIEFKMQARGIVNIDADCDTVEITTAEILAELEELEIDVSDVDTILVSGMFAGDVDYFETEGIDRAMANMNVTVSVGAASELLVDSWAAPCNFANAIPVFPLALDDCGTAGSDPCFVAVPVEAVGVSLINGTFAQILSDLKNGLDRTYTVSACWEGCSLPSNRTTNFDWRMRVFFNVAGKVIVESPRT